MILLCQHVKKFKHFLKTLPDSAKVTIASKASCLQELSNSEFDTICELSNKGFCTRHKIIEAKTSNKKQLKYTGLSTTQNA